MLLLEANEIVEFQVAIDAIILLVSHGNPYGCGAERNEKQSE